MSSDQGVVALSADDLARRLRELGALLHACVHDGASVSFLLPFSQAESEQFWRQKVLPGVQADSCVLLVAQERGVIVGGVQLDCDTPPNQPHRAEIRKLLVHPSRRRRGIARTLMATAEDEARRRGRRLLTLDTRTGDKAEPLYKSLGYLVAGIIPDFCRDTIVNRLDPTTIMYKRLGDETAAGQLDRVT